MTTSALQLSLSKCSNKLCATRPYCAMTQTEATWTQLQRVMKMMKRMDRRNWTQWQAAMKIHSWMGCHRRLTKRWLRKCKVQIGMKDSQQWNSWKIISKTRNQCLRNTQLNYSPFCNPIWKMRLYLSWRHAWNANKYYLRNAGMFSVLYPMPKYATHLSSRWFPEQITILKYYVPSARNWSCLCGTYTITRDS